MRISSADGAEEFVWLLGQCLVHYGSLIAHGMYQHIQVANQPEACESCHVHNWGDGEGNQKSQHNQQNQPKSVAEADEQVLQTNPPSQPIRRATPSAKSSRKEDEHEVHLRETIDSMRVDLDETGTVLEFGHIAGLDEVKLALEQFACFFLHFPHLTRNLRQRSTTGILLFGPQGTGKTLLVRSFAQRYGLALYDVRASAIMSKFVGESEKFIRTLFSEVRAHAPAVLLLDECDGLLCDPTADAMQSHNYRLLQNEIKNQWSDLMHSRDEVIVIGATNKPHDIDMDGFGRRLSLKLHVDLPNAEGCMLILEKALGRLRHQVDKDDFPVLGFLCHEKGLSGYDIDVLVESLLRRALRDITVAQHFVAIPWEESEIIVPCADNHIGAMSGPWTRFEPEAVSYSPFAFSQVETAISKAKPTVDHTMRQKHAGFAEQYSAE